VFWSEVHLLILKEVINVGRKNQNTHNRGGDPCACLTIKEKIAADAEARISGGTCSSDTSDELNNYYVGIKAKAN
jgi:hypothetical protein